MHNINGLCGFSQNQLKIIAAVTMAIDHIGAELFSDMEFLRIIGRLSFPLFSFFIYEGFKYTRNRLKYFLKIFSLGIVCIIGYYIYAGIIYANVLITFSLSICIMYSIQVFYDCCLKGNTKKIVISSFVLLFCVMFTFYICSIITVDYGFYGAILPIFPQAAYLLLKKYDTDSRTKYFIELSFFSVGLIILSVQLGGTQLFSLLALLLLAGYTGLRGKKQMKNFFYWFYPVHLLLIGLVAEI